MKRSTLLSLGAVLLLVAGAGWYWGSPAYAMSQLRDAALSGDEDALEDRIDFPSVRESLKADMAALMMAQVANQEQDGFAAFGAALAMGMVGPMVDAMVTPAGMATMVKQGRLQRPGDTQEDEGAPAEWTIEREGFDQFRAKPETTDGSEPPSLVFERDGLGWRLVEIDIPDELASATQ